MKLFTGSGEDVEAIRKICSCIDYSSALIPYASKAQVIKTCTGFAEGKATLHDIALIKEAAQGRLKIKASGGVASLEDQAAFLAAGASRVAGRFNIVSQMQKLGLDGF